MQKGEKIMKSARPRLGFESLEQRLVQDSSWQNPFLPNDVDGTQRVDPLDVLDVINTLNLNGARDLPDTKPPEEPFCDVNGDRRLDPTDVLTLIDAINRARSPIFVQSAPDSTQDLNRNGVVLNADLRVTGKTLPGAFVDYVNPLTETRGRVTADDNGAFQIPLLLQEGAYDIQVTAMDDLGRKLPMISQVRVGNVVHEWNSAVLNVVRDWRGVTNDPAPNTRFTSEPPRVGRNIAMIQGAMFDAINAISPAYEPFVFTASLPQQGLDPNIAAAAAAYRAASYLYPTFLSVWDSTLEESLRAFSNSATRQPSIDFGTQVANAVIEARANDGSDATVNYTPGNQPGDWNRTPPAFLAPFLPQWPDVTPFAMSSPDQFLPPAPPALNTEAYAIAVDQVMKLGSKTSTTRTAAQTNIANFWADGGGTFTPPGHWNRIAADTSLKNKQNLIDSARTMALVNIALADAGISCWDAKYLYELWRPIDAIRKADTDGNPATVQDPTWSPLLVTPPFPAYTSGHSTFSAASAQVLTLLFGDNYAFVTQMDQPTNTSQVNYDPSKRVVRNFSSFTQAAEEASMSRIYGGIHFLFDGTQGLASGYSIGSLVYNSKLRALIG